VSISFHDPSINVVGVLLQKLVKSIGCLDISLLHDPNFAFGEAILVRMPILNVLKSNIRGFEQVIVSKEVNELKIDLITVVWLHVLILG